MKKKENKLDLEKLNKMLDKALENETQESLDKWINEQQEKSEEEEKETLQEDPEEIKRKIKEEEERNIQEKVRELKEMKGLKFPCSNFPLYCVRVGVTMIQDIQGAIKNAKTGRCDFEHKCKKKKESCISAIPPRSNFKGGD